VNLGNGEHSNGAFHIRVISDTTAGADLLRSGLPLVFTLTDQKGHTITLGQPQRIVSQDVNGDGILDQQLKFRRSALKGLSSGTVTVQVTTSADSTGEKGQFVLFGPGEHEHKHGGGDSSEGPGSNGQGHGRGSQG
jgi:hypothetical protein